MKTKKTYRKISPEKWEEIRILLKSPDRNISKIARQYNMSRENLYNYAWRRNWIKKKEKSFFNKLKEVFK